MDTAEIPVVGMGEDRCTLSTNRIAELEERVAILEETIERNCAETDRWRSAIFEWAGSQHQHTEILLAILAAVGGMTNVLDRDHLDRPPRPRPVSVDLRKVS